MPESSVTAFSRKRDIGGCGENYVECFARALLPSVCPLPATKTVRVLSFLQAAGFILTKQAPTQSRFQYHHFLQCFELTAMLANHGLPSNKQNYDS